MDIKEKEKEQPTKCIRCALERGVNPESTAAKCVWKRAGKFCPDYDKRPDMDSITTDDIPDDEKGIIRSQMKLLAEKSRFLCADQLVKVTEAMAGLYKCLTGNESGLPNRKE